MLEGSAAQSSLRTPPGFPTGAAGRSLSSGSRRSADNPSRCRRDSVLEAGMVRQTSWRRPPVVEPCCGGPEQAGIPGSVAFRKEDDGRPLLEEAECPPKRGPVGRVAYHRKGMVTAHQ